MSTLSKNSNNVADFYNRKGSVYPFSEAVRVGDTIYLSGQIGVGPNGLVQGFEPQMRRMMDNVAATLKDMGLGMEHLVKCTVFLRDLARWQDFNAIYVTYFEDGRYPARSAFGAVDLALGADAEIECVAVASQTS